MYAMFGKLAAHPGKRCEFAGILSRAADVVAQLPGCRMYIIHEDLSDADTLWVYEAWDDKESHDESLNHTQVRALISEAMPLMAGAPQGSELMIVAGHGL